MRRAGSVHPREHVVVDQLSEKCAHLALEL
jgi:hypothetical protein